MEYKTRQEFATLLRAATSRSIPEKDFWGQLKRLADDNPYYGMAFESATHYWGNFHQRNLLLIPVKPDRYQVLQGQNELNLIADGVEGNWPSDELKRKLKDI